MYYNYGTIDSGNGKTNQQLTLGGQTYVTGLPTGVTVTDITYTFWMQNRPTSTATGPGTYWMGHSSASTARSCSSSGCSASWTPTSGSGFLPTVTNTANNHLQTYPDGNAVRSWDVNMTWSAARDRVGTYTQTDSGCQNFTTGPSGRFAVNYTNVNALTTTDVRNGGKTIRSYADVVATLSDGTQLETTVSVVYSG